MNPIALLLVAAALATPFGAQAATAQDGLEPCTYEDGTPASVAHMRNCAWDEEGNLIRHAGGEEAILPIDVSDEGSGSGAVWGVFFLAACGWLLIGAINYARVADTAEQHGQSKARAFGWAMLYGPMWIRLYRSNPELLDQPGFKRFSILGRPTSVVDGAARDSRDPERSPGWRGRRRDPVEGRLMRLDALLARGTITQEEHKRRREEILDQI